MPDMTTTHEKKQKSSLKLILMASIVFFGLVMMWLYENQKPRDYLEIVLGYDESQISAHINGGQPLNIEALSTPRILGDPQAPIKISEHSSFTCGACRNYHAQTFKDLKRDYIDTGKAYLVFDDFPRNPRDLTISAIARCVPDDSYFKFVQLMFETQEEWNVPGNYLQQIKERAAMAGGNVNKIERCSQSRPLKEAIAHSAKVHYDNKTVTHTPTLIVNDTIQISGNTAYEEIQNTLDTILREAEEKALAQKEQELKAQQQDALEALETPSTAETIESSVESASGDIAQPSAFNLEQAATPRILGTPNAPIKITEHSSFSCPHCAHFHSETFKRIKTDFIDTGKAYLVFDDFPLGGTDILIGSMARCIPQESYFNFVQLVFSTQSEWKKRPDYMDFLKKNAQLTGASEEQLDQCANSKELQEIIAERAQEAYKNKDVKGTPTLIIDNGAPMSGLAPYSEIKAAIESALQKQRPEENTAP